MTYNEWRDELKSNLLCVSEPERRRVLDYYAEAYADRRDAGFSEREIIQDFGAPCRASLPEAAEEGYKQAGGNNFRKEGDSCNFGLRMPKLMPTDGTPVFQNAK